MKDPYQVLGIEQHALHSPDEITNAFVNYAYRKLAKVHHPDRGGDPLRFKEITAARDALLKPEGETP